MKDERHTSGECRKVTADVPAYLDGALPADRAGEVEAHLASCAACAEAAERLRRAWSLLDAHDAPAPPDELRSRVWAAVLENRAAGRSRNLRARWRLATLAGSLMVAISVTTATCRVNLRSTRADVAAILAASPEEVEMAQDQVVVENLDFLMQCDLLDDPQVVAALESL